jgi:DNA-binding MarR family transcriptional regulator
LPDCTGLPYNFRMDTPAFRRFRRAYSAAARLLDTDRLHEWEQSRLTLPQLRVLYQIRRRPGSTTGELSRALGITVSTTSGLVIKLVDRGLVQRTTVPDDRRQAPLHLTEAGAAVAGELSDLRHAFLEQVAAELGDDLDAVVEALERLAEAAGRVRAAESAESDAQQPVQASAGVGR